MLVGELMSDKTGDPLAAGCHPPEAKRQAYIYVEPEVCVEADETPIKWIEQQLW